MNAVRFIINNTPLFSGVSERTVAALVSDPATRTVGLSRGETLCARGEANGELIIILSGRAEVRKGSVPVRMLSPGDVTGVSTLFGEDAVMDSQITAQTKLAALCIDKRPVRAAIAADPTFAEGYIRFLSARIRFLNGIIDRCAGTDSVRRLARYLYERARECGTEFTFNATLAASRLDMGRATLYRAFEQLEERGFVKKTGRTVAVTDEGALEDYFKEKEQ